MNPYSIDGSADALAEALNMSRQEQSRRMRGMRSAVAEFNSFWWAGQILEDAARVRRHARRGDRSQPQRRMENKIPA